MYRHVTVVAVVVVGASDGYPGHYTKGKPIELPPPGGDDSWLIHAGTARRKQDLVTAGGCVMGAVGTGGDLEAARGAAYGLLERTHFEGLTFRRDIAVAKGVKT